MGTLREISVADEFRTALFEDFELMMKRFLKNELTPSELKLWGKSLAMVKRLREEQEEKEKEKKSAERDKKRLEKEKKELLERAIVQLLMGNVVETREEAIRILTPKKS